MSIHHGRICLAVAKVDGVVEEPVERSALRPVSNSAQPDRSMCRASAALVSQFLRCSLQAELSAGRPPLPVGFR
jgi:hypothetical protein